MTDTCTHLDQVADVEPSSKGCEDCEPIGGQRVDPPSDDFIMRNSACSTSGCQPFGTHAQSAAGTPRSQPVPKESRRLSRRLQAFLAEIQLISWCRREGHRSSGSRDEHDPA